MTRRPASAENDVQIRRVQPDDVSGRAVSFRSLHYHRFCEIVYFSGAPTKNVMILVRLKLDKNLDKIYVVYSQQINNSTYFLFSPEKLRIYFKDLSTRLLKR